ncbi:hypothetical protein GW17_00000778 [Ensete ventricosum]|nr:hypothetical protein GW17_00000778 [Ensete ventricosum]
MIYRPWAISSPRAVRRNVSLHREKERDDVELILYYISSSTLVHIALYQVLYYTELNSVCRVCEMAVVWMQNQLRQNQTQEHVLNYINELCERLPSPMGESSVDCAAISLMPEVSFTIGNKTFELTAEQV